jgi:tetratricopeptide (TPR) repeat protein
MTANLRPLALILLLATLGGPLAGQQTPGLHEGLEPCLDFLRRLPQASVTSLVKPNAAVLEAFGRFDGNGDGWLSSDELARYVRDPEDLPPDLDGDGRVSTREFLLAVTQTAPLGAELYSVDHARFLLEGRRAFEAGDFRQALRRYWAAANEDQDCPDGVLGMGRCLERLGLNAEAVQAFRRAVELAPGMAEARLNLAVAEERLGLHDAALAGLRLALRQLEASAGLREGWLADPGWRADTLDLVAVLRRRLAAAGALPELAGELDAFLARFGGAGSVAPRQLLAQVEVCEVGELLERGCPREAMARLLALEARLPHDWQLRLTEASLWTLLGRFDAAREALTVAGALGGLPQALLPESFGNHLDLGNEAAAAVEAERLKQFRLEFWEVADLAWQMVHRGHFRRALAPLTLLMEHKAGPGALPRLLLGLCLHATGELTRAREVLRPDPRPASDNPVLLALETRLCLSLGLKQKALAAARAAVRLAPGAPEGWLNLAVAEEVGGGREAALDALRQARRLWPAGRGLAPFVSLVDAWLEGRPAEALTRTLPVASDPPAAGNDSSRKMR